MAHIVGIAQGLYEAACEDASFLASLKEEYRKLLTGLMDGSSVGTIVSGTKNGSTYNMRLSCTIDERRAAMKMAIRACETGVRPSSKSIIKFGSCRF